VRTHVAIIGAGPAGLTLALLLERRGIESVVLEARDRAYVQARVRAGLLEQNTVDLLHQLGVGERLEREGFRHKGFYLRRRGRTEHLDLSALTGRHTTIYGQQEVVKDLIAALLQRGGRLLFDAHEVTVHDADSKKPRLSFIHEGSAEELTCDFIAGCDGFHGVSRASVPEGVLTEHNVAYPVGWLGILAQAPPATDELIYAWHPNGFSLYSMRSSAISRLYLEVPADDDIDEWTDERVWSELQLRQASEGWQVNEGPIIEKSITLMRSFVVEPMQYGRLFLAGDAAHIVPPTGAKGLNLAVNDVRLLANAFGAHYETGSGAMLDAYTATALRRVWRAQDFSNDMLHLLHRLDGDPYQRQLQLARLDHLERSEAAARSFAENYVGLPTTPDF
jgi:p-hydroxybenzoate 3-monooxygenase